MSGLGSESKYADTNDEMATDETINLIASDKVEGTAVYDRNGNHLGSVHTAMINKVSGQVAYVVISFGGFLGIGAKFNALPWNSLVYDHTMGGYVVNVTRDQLRGAPHYAVDVDPWIDPRYGNTIDDYYRGTYLR